MPRKKPTRQDEESDSSESFQTPSTQHDVTNYSLAYSRNRPFNPDLPSTSAMAATRQKYYARKSTALSPHGRNAPIRKTLSNQRHNTEASPRRCSSRLQTPAVAETTANVRRPRKQKKPERSAQMRYYDEMKRLNSITGFLIPRAPFGRFVRELMNERSVQVKYITRTALEAIQESTELYLTQVFTDAYALTCHRGRVTLMPKDIQLLRLIRLIE